MAEYRMDEELELEEEELDACDGVEEVVEVGSCGCRDTAAAEPGKFPLVIAEASLAASSR